MKCPTHGTDLLCKPTRYGLRHGCPVAGCTVVCWDGRTSTPADLPTRNLRHACHEAFDPLWRNRTRWQSRGAAYVWLRGFMGLTRETAHIGMFDSDQCRKLLAELLQPRLTPAHRIG
jgi:hypothetical protein